MTTEIMSALRFTLHYLCVQLWNVSDIMTKLLFKSKFSFAVEKPSGTTSTLPTPTVTQKAGTDPLSAYMNRVGGGRGGHKWNEHDYYVKAMNDMHLHHQDKMAKVRTT